MRLQVTQKVPMLANDILQGIPTTLDVKGLELNISLAGAAIPEQHTTCNHSLISGSLCARQGCPTLHWQS